MLILSRRVGESLLIGDHVAILVLRISPGQVGLAIAAPLSDSILRTELEHERRPVEYVADLTLREGR